MELAEIERDSPHELRKLGQWWLTPEALEAYFKRREQKSD
jgi:hypothetical protein